MNDLLFKTGFPDQEDSPLFKIPQAAVQQAAGTTAGAFGEVLLVNQANLQSAHRSITDNSRADNAPTDDQHIEGICAQLRP